MGNCGPGGKLWQPTAGFMTHITCRLTAKNQDQLRNRTLGNRVWATFLATQPTAGVRRCHSTISEQHADGTNRLAMYDFLLVFHIFTARLGGVVVE